MQKLSTIQNNREQHIMSTKAQSHTEIENRIIVNLNMHTSSSIELNASVCAENKFTPCMQCT